jgi:replication initiation and membrane attachment protein
MLYQPIIGSMPISLYFTLWSNLDRMHMLSDEYLHEQLAKNLGVSLNMILEAREKLEAVGLIKTYVKKGSVNSYIYELYSPLSPYEFFNNPLLNTALYTNAGKSEYKKLTKYFELPKIDLSEYQDISVSFGDVFESVAFNQSEGLYDTLRKKSINNVEVVPNIDLSLVLDMIPDELLNKKSITKDTKDFIYKLSFIYNLKDTDVKELISDSISVRKTIDKDKLRENCLKYYSFENYGSNPTIIYRTQPENLRSSIKSTSTKAKAIYMFETTSPHDFLVSKTGVASLSKNDAKLLEHLMIDLDLKAGVVNVLIDYVLKINNNKLTPNFVESIALQWKRSNIETVEDAIDMAKKEYKSRNGKKVTISKITPKWMNKTVEAEVANPDEEKEMKELLSEYE